MLGHYVSLPVYIAPAAMAKLGHPLGEVNLTRGAGECGIVQGVSYGGSHRMKKGWKADLFPNFCGRRSRATRVVVWRRWWKPEKTGRV